MRKRHLGRPPGSSSESTTARILAAARICFARSGFAATTNKQIADEAGVTTAALYLYFDSKMALYLATVRDAYAELLPHFRSAIAQTRSLRDAFRALLAASARLHEQDPSLTAFLSTLPLEMRRHEELAEAMTQQPSDVVAIVQEVVDAGVRAREISAAVAPRVVSLFVACTLGLSVFAASIDGTHLGEVVEAFNALIDGTLFRRPPQRRGRRAAPERTRR